MPVTKSAILPVFILAAVPLCAQNAGVIGGFGGVLPDYDGPSVLGRGGPLTGMRGTEAVPIRLQLFVNGEYNSNLLGFSLKPDGTFDSRSSYGVTAGLTASGRKLYRRAYVGLEYAGNNNHYTGLSLFNGSNHQLNLATAKQIGAKLQLFSQTGAGTSNRFVGNQGVFTGNEFEFLSAPISEIFDARTYFIGTTAGATYNLNSRQSFRATGTGSSIRRRSRALVDFQSYGASGDWAYRISRRTSIGVMYQFSHFDFSKVFGESDISTIGFHAGRKFGRDWSVDASITGSKQSSVGVRSVRLDPVLEAILGRSTGSEVFESNNLVYGYNFRVARRIRRSTGELFSQRAINPGNGLLMTSIMHTAGASFSHSIRRDISVHADVGYSKLTSLGFAFGSFKGWTSGGDITYKLSDSFGVNARFSHRTFNVANSPFARTGYLFSLGVTYFPQQGIAGVF